MNVDPAVRAGRFTAKLVTHEDPDVVERLQELAHENAVSQAALVRLAIRRLLERVDNRPDTRVG